MPAAAAVLIYLAQVSGAAYVTFEPSGKLSGVLVDGVEPYVNDYTTADAKVITLAGHSGLPNTAAVRDSSYPDKVLNPAALGRQVVVCQTQIYYRGDPPHWCRHAELVKAHACTDPFGVSCDTATIDRHGVWSWSDDGHWLFERKAPDNTAMAVTATIGVLVLAVAEAGAGLGTGLPAWVRYDAVGWSAATSILAGADWSAAIVHGAALGAAFALRDTDSPLVPKALATSVAVTVALSVPAGAVGAGAASLLNLVLAVVVAGFAGKRGALWALPWAYIHGVRPMVVQAAALDLRGEWVEPFVSALLLSSLVLLGFSASDPALPSWYDYFLHRRYRRDNELNTRGSRMVPLGASRKTNLGALQ